MSEGRRFTLANEVGRGAHGDDELALAQIKVEDIVLIRKVIEHVKYLWTLKHEGNEEEFTYEIDAYLMNSLDKIMPFKFSQYKSVLHEIEKYKNKTALAEWIRLSLYFSEEMPRMKMERYLNNKLEQVEDPLREAKTQLRK